MNEIDKEYDLSDLELKDLNGIYADIARMCDMRTAAILHKKFHAQTVTFPVKFMNVKSAYARIAEQKSKGVSVKDLAQQYTYTERWIRDIIRRYKK